MCCEGIFNIFALKRLNKEVVKTTKPNESEFQYQGQLDQDLEEWLSPRRSKSVHGFFSEEEKQEYIQIEYSALDGAIIINQAPYGETPTMLAC